ncbi:hypothetical protein I3843_04G172500 [Carya illinoinensis]|nr:hypothetical protein I3843_04G172500 [Carya illinoinensis]
MAVIGNSFVKVRKSSSGFTDVLISTACEWFLIFLLLVDAILSYFLTKFASYCKLHPPCILCSRIDHLLGNEKPKFYQHMLCSNHRSEISSLISCHIHGKLVSGNGMCEDCLLSFTMKNNSSQETHRLLVSILGMDLVGYGFHSTLQNDDFISSSKSTKLCSCCNKPWRSRQKAQRLQQLKLSMSGLSSNYIHLPSHSQLNRRHRLKKIRDKFSGLETSHLLGKSGFDSLLHVGYSKLKITFDSEYEVPFTDDDGGGHVIPKKSEPKGDSKVQCTSKTPTKTISKDMEFLASDVATDHGLSELNWLQVNQKFDPYALPELTSLDDIPQVANVMEKPVSVESGLESWDASLSEIEGENLLDKLKQQVDKDRKCIRDLYKELEEERNASEIATNQAMAMITRLQEEKAALYMEALQYLRMMEEQAEYNVEALEKANDLLAKKERDTGFGSGDNENVHYKSMRTEVPKSSDEPFVTKTPCLEFEEEKLYISQRLKNLERKLHQFSCDSTLSNMPNGGHFEKLMTGINDQEESIICKMSHQSDCQMEVKGSCMENDLHISNGSLTSHEGLVGSNGDNHYISEGNNFVNSSGEKHLMHQREIDFVVLGNEILDLNERLQALEEDNDFLEQSLNSLQNGSEGLQFVQEIAHQLQELRKIGIRLRCQSIT